MKTYLYALLLLTVYQSISYSKTTVPNHCKNKSLNECSKIARNQFIELAGLPPDPPQFFYDTCLLGDDFSCVVYAGAIAAGFIQTPYSLKDILKEVKIDELIFACKKGEAFSCIATSIAYKYGFSTDPSSSESFHYAELACELGLGRGCTRVGKYYMEGEFAKQSNFLAFKYFKRGCYMNDPTGCLKLGYCYEKGLGVEQSKDLASTYYDGLCKTERELGCTYLAIMAD